MFSESDIDMIWYGWLKMMLRMELQKFGRSLIELLEDVLRYWDIQYMQGIP
jgi:hypothetical protein